MARDHEPPLETGPAPGRRRKLRRWACAGACLAAVSLVVVGPWPADNTSYRGSAYEQRTVARLERLGQSTTAADAFRVGLAEADISPPPGLPLAGFSKQARTPFVAVDTPCFARALTVQSGKVATTILTADLLLINDKLAHAVLERTGLRPEQVYFTASHTHNGPGGWGDHPLEALVAGKYDPSYFRTLADQLAAVVTKSRQALVPAEAAVVTARPAHRQKNRIDPAAPTHDQLTALIFRRVGDRDGAPPLAILTVFGAHATVFRAEPPRLSSDYAGALAAALKQRTGAGMVLFAAGAVGDASPVRPLLRSPSDRARTLGESLADDLMSALPTAVFDPRPAVAGLRLDVEMPPLRVPVGRSWRLSPIATSWISGSRTHLDVLRIGRAVLVGMPGDYAGHLAQPLADWARTRGLTLVATSFNGDYKGYFVSQHTFMNRSCYETRWMNFFGPWSGEYLAALARRAIVQIEPTPAPRVATARPHSAWQ